MIEYTVYDRRNGQEVGCSLQPDVSSRSEMAAIRASSLRRSHYHFAEVVTREASPEACRPWVGKRFGDA